VDLTAGVIAPGRKPGRPCSICINYDRRGIEQWILEGRPFSEILAQYPDLTHRALARHVKQGHILQSVAKRVATKYNMDMDSILGKVQSSIDRTESRITGGNGKEPIDPKYVAPNERVIIEGSKLLSGIVVESIKLKQEQDKIDSKYSNTDTIKLTKIIDHIRLKHPDMIQEFIELLKD